MPRDSNGVYSLPAGNPVVSGEDITSAWANSTLTDIASALTGSLSRTGQGGMQSTLLFGDGTVSAPGIAWTQEPGTGFYRAGTNDMRVAVAGDGDVMRWFEDTVYIRNAADSAWAPLLYEGGAGTVPDGSASGDTLVWDNGTDTWDTQAANPGGVLPVGSPTLNLLAWNNTDSEWEAVEWADISHVEDGSSDGQALYWDDTNGLWSSTSILNMDPIDGIVTIGAGMTGLASHKLSVLNTLWVGNGDGTAGINLCNISDAAMVLAAGTRAAPTTGALPLAIECTVLTFDATSGATTFQSGGTTSMSINGNRQIGMGGSPGAGVRVKVSGVSGDTAVLQVVDSSDTEILAVLENGNIRMTNLPTSDAGLPAGTLWRHVASGEMRVAA